MTERPQDPDADADASAAAASAAAASAAAIEAERWLVVDGRRWPRTDPSLPPELVEALTSHLGRGRSGVRAAKRAGDDAAIATARERVSLAKHGLGERGPRWWDEPEDARLARAQEALRALEALDGREPR